jgi:hypothetical protein
MSAARFDWRGVVARALLNLFLVFAVYNPSGRSYVHWVLDGFDWFWAKLMVGGVLVATFVMLWRTTRGVIGHAGIALVLVVSLAASMTLARLTGHALFDGVSPVVWLLASLAAVFTVGLSWSPLHHRLAGITHTEELKK